MNPILVVGSVALDSVETPEGRSSDALGGSAVYFSLAARHFSPVRLVGVVGDDFPERHRKMLAGHGIDVTGLAAQQGRTFRWKGKFGRDMDVATTFDTQLNVFEKFDPQLSAEQKSSPVLFLGNIDPELQSGVLSQMTGPKIVAVDTMNFWIDSKKDCLKKLLSRVDVLFCNEEEAQSLSGQAGNVRALRVLAGWGPSVVILKKGEHGALMFAHDKVYPFPAFPVEAVMDPTGAGDSFAGGFMGCLAAHGSLKDVEKLKSALVYGTVMSSFNVAGFSTRHLEELSRKDLDARHREYVDLLSVLSRVPA